MARISWRATSAGAYWIDVVVGGLPLSLMVDTGLTDPQNQIGFALEPATYDQLKQGRQLSHFRARVSRDASGRYVTVETGETTAQLLDPTTRGHAGPIAHLFVSRGTPGVPGRVGVPFFHRLKGCRVEWDLDAHTMTIEYP